MAQKVDRTICDANQPSPCTNNPAGSNVVICEPTETHLLSKPTHGRYWIASASNPSSAFVDTTGLVTGITANGEYRFILVSPLDNCFDTVSITRLGIPSFGVLLSQPTCAGSNAKKDGYLQLTDFETSATFGITTGTLYDETVIQQAIPANGILLQNISNPSSVVNYIIRVVSAHGCYTDKKVTLQPVYCECPVELCVPFQIQQRRKK